MLGVGVGAVAPRRRAARALRAPPPVRPSLGEPASASPGMTGCKVPAPPSRPLPGSRSRLPHDRMGRPVQLSAPARSGAGYPG
jgi:hypothetical protein